VAALEPLQASDGSYAHAGAASLEDTLAMGRAFLSLAEATGDSAWRGRAARVAGALDRFRDPRGIGFVTGGEGPSAGVFGVPVRDLDDNVVAARFTNLLFREGAGADQAERAQLAMRLVTSPQELGKLGLPFGTLLADEELRHAPLHIVVVGPGKTAPAQALLAAARAAPTRYKWVQLWDPSEPRASPQAEPRASPADGDDGEAPPVPPKPLDVAYACGPTFCSPPARTKAALETTLGRQLASW
jgi:uncharacterized protein YyaL (SSP411 family)